MAGALWTAAYLLAGIVLVLRSEHRQQHAQLTVTESVTAIVIWPVTFLVVAVIIWLRRRK